MVSLVQKNKSEGKTMKQMKKYAAKNLTDAVLLFLTGAFLGWLYEMVLYLFKDGTFVNRGVLHGPWLPIYGFGCLVVVWLKKRVGKKPMAFFGISVLACAVIEYFGSWLLETLYHMRWWDYSDCWMNLNGRIFLGGLLGFGAAGMLFAYGLYPILKKKLGGLSRHNRELLSTVLLSVFLLDTFLSVLVPNVGMGITN